MKKAVIVTECRKYCFNFGETLQAVALNRVIQHLGFESVTASYENRIRDIRYRISIYPKMYITRGIKFELFRIRNMKYPVFRSCHKEHFSKLLKKADVIFCGSDCIWYEACYNEIFFLNFPDIKVPKIAYAPSLRNSRVRNRTYKLKAAQWIKGIDYLSTRERDGSNIIQEMIQDKSVSTVLDPTLLSGKKEWDAMCSKQIIKEPYILCYMLGKTKTIGRFVSQVAQHYNNHKIIWIEMEGNNGYCCGQHLSKVGPAEFLSLIRYSDAVITDSFHGTAFSIIYHKQVYAVKRIVDSRDNYSYDCRIKNIMELLNIDNYYNKCDIIDFDKANIDYLEVEKKLKRLRRKSMNYIKSALKEEGLLENL